MKDYLIKFNDDGTRGITYAKGIHYGLDGFDDLIDADQLVSDGYVWVDSADYQNLLGNNAEGKEYYRTSDGTYEPLPDPEPPTLDEKKDALAGEVRSWANNKMSAVQSGYSEPEISSFEQQESGANDIIAGNTDTTDAQAVISLLTVRLGLSDGETPTADQQTAFAQRILTNASTARTALIQIMGTQQRLELAIRAVTTEDEFTAVKEQVDAVIN